MDNWEKLRYGQVDEAIRAFRDEYDKHPKNPSHAMRLGVTYLWEREWEAAWNLFHEFMEVYPWTTDFAFKFAGTARWCAGDRDQAIVEWRNGVNCEYSDMAGGVTVPLLLYFAATAEPELCGVFEAIELLRERARSKFNHRWPRPLALLILGDIGKTETLNAGVDHTRTGALRHMWQVEFWNGVAARAAGNVAEYEQAMNLTSSLTWDDFDRDRELFIERIWDPEFFLARSEVRRIKSPSCEE